jgi:mannose-6-phosphate isomerase
MTGNDSRFANGPFAGKSLGEIWPALPIEWAGTLADRTAPFPLLVKFIFSEDKLSVQVHPDDDYAGRHEKLPDGSPARGKTEMWYAMGAREGAEVLVGLKPEITLEKFKRAIGEGTAEDCLQRIGVRAGEAIFVPAGTAHTLGAGLVLAEIQEQSDLTYRVFDYNRHDAHGRARELHIEQALRVMRFGEQRGGRIEPIRTERDGVTVTHFIACRFFATEKWEFAAKARGTTSREHFDLMVILEGSGEIECGDGRFPYGPAEAWLFPAALGDFHFAAKSRTALLRTYVPNGPEEFLHALSVQGISDAASRRLIHF